MKTAVAMKHSAPLSNACVLLLLFFCHTATSAQSFVETEYVVVDRGSQMNGSDGALRLYTRSGTMLATLASSGSGAMRGAAFADTGELFVARGNDILRYTGDPLTPDTMPFVTGSKAQDVVVNPVTGNIICSFGTNAGSANIMELDSSGTIVQMITDPLLAHPRSIALNYSADTLFVANQSAGNVLAIDLATGTVQVHANIASQFPNYGPIGITTAPDVDDLVYVVSDYGSGPTEIVSLDGPSGSPTITSFLNFGSLSDLTSPAGIYADDYGNLFIAGRSKNMGTPGVYTYRRATGMRPALPFLGSEHVNPIDIAFARSPVTFSLTSSDGVSPSSGLPRVSFGTQNAQLVFDIQAPDFANMAFAIFYSLIPDSAALATVNDPFRPLGGGIPFETPDTRTLPLLLDSFFLQSLALIQAGGNGAPVLLDPAACPNSTAGFFLRPQGATDSQGVAQAILTMPSLPCLPPNFTAYMAFSLVLVDGQTLPALVGAATSYPLALALERP